MQLPYLAHIHKGSNNEFYMCVKVILKTHSM